MKRCHLSAVLICGALFLAGCVSGERMMRNSPFDGNKFYRDGINLFPLYYQEGVNRSILFPFVDIDDRGFAVRPFFHKDRDEYGILWPLAAFNSEGGWAGTFYWREKRGFYGGRKFGLLPLFIKDDRSLWVFPASWWKGGSAPTYAVLPFFYRNVGNGTTFVVNVFKDKETFLIVPFYGQGKDWFYLLNFIRHSRDDKRSYIVLPLGFFSVDNDGKELLTPLFSFRTGGGELRMFNLAMLLYHYSLDTHRFFYPFFNVSSGKHSREFWLWPLVYYGFNHSVTFAPFLFSYSESDYSWQGNGVTLDFDATRIKVLSPLLFDYEYRNGTQKSTTKVLPWGALWYAKSGKDDFDHRILGGALYRNSKSKNSRRFSLLYKLFSYHRYKQDVKWEFFPFIKIVGTPKGNSWSFFWRLLEQHDGGGHIFFIPLKAGKAEK